MMSSVWFIEKMNLAENEDLFGLGEDRANTLFGLTHSMPDSRYSESTQLLI